MNILRDIIAGVLLLALAGFLIYTLGCAPAPLGPVDHHPESKDELPLANGELPTEFEEDQHAKD